MSSLYTPVPQADMEEGEGAGNSKSSGAAGLAGPAGDPSDLESDTISHHILERVSLTEEDVSADKL